MKKILFVFTMLSLTFILSCNKENLVNDPFDVYGLYTTFDESQVIQSINFSEAYIHIIYVDLSEDRIENYSIIDNKVFTESNQLIMEILSFKKNKKMEIYFEVLGAKFIFNARG